MRAIQATYRGHADMDWAMLTSIAPVCELDQNEFSQMGFEDVASVNGGTDGWRAAKQALASGDTDSEPQRFIESECHSDTGLFAPSLRS